MDGDHLGCQRKALYKAHLLKAVIAKSLLASSDVIHILFQWKDENISLFYFLLILLISNFFSKKGKLFKWFCVSEIRMAKR
jgi:hypothetical protein